MKTLLLFFGLMLSNVLWAQDFSDFQEWCSTESRSRQLMAPIFSIFPETMKQ